MILTKDKIESLDLFGKIDNEIRNGNIENLLLIVPTNRKLRAVKKNIIDHSQNKTVTKINIETLNTLTTKLLEQLEQFNQLSEAASSVFIKQGAEQISLGYFTNYKGSIPNGTLDRIKNVISEYKKHGITPDVLLKESEVLEASEKLKAFDIAYIYQKYKELTEGINAYEIGDVYEKLLTYGEDKLSESFNKLYPGIEFAALLGFDQFTLPEIKIILSISELTNSKLYIDFDYGKFNPLIFSHLQDTYESIERFGFNRVEDKSVYEFNGFIKTVREKLFLRSTSAPVDKFQNEISIMKARNTEEEIQLIAKQIKSLIIDLKVQPHDICVVFNLISNFSPVVRDTFERYGIPFNLTDRTSLDQSSPVIGVINVLEILENDFYYKNIFRAFSGRFLQHFEIDTVNLNITASRLKIVSGYHNWINTIKNELASQSEDDEKINNERLESALVDLKKIDEILKPFSQMLTPSEFFNELVKFITVSNIAVTILEGHSEYREEDIAALSTFIETIDEILQLIEKQGEEDTKHSLGFYLDQIKTASSWARFNIKGRSDYGVLVTSVNEIRGLTFDHLFIAGMNDGIFPTRYTPEIFFSGSFTKKEITHQTEERYHFYQALSTWRKHLYLTSAAVGEDKELVESVFMKDFSNLFTCKEISNSNFEAIAYSEEDVQINKGILIGSGNIPLESLDNDLIKKIKVQKIREKFPHEENTYNGFVKLNNDSQIYDSLEKFANREYSITQLETYAKCPFKYFMQYVLRLTEIGEPTEEVEPIEIGSILHKVLFDFFTELRDENIILKDCSEKNFKKAEDIIFRIAKKNVESPLFSSELSFYEKERILGIKENKEDSILYQFLLSERNNKSESVPSYFEVAFGTIGSKIRDRHLSTTEPVIGGNVKFRGKIDRLDVNNTEESFDVVDYKLSLSSKPTKADINDGISLQLPLYMFAAKKLFEQNEIQLSPEEVYLYSLKFGENDLRKQSISLIDKKAENREKEINSLIDDTLKKIENYVDKIVKGEFPLTSLKDRENKVCKYCDFTKICRIEETDL